MARVLGWDEDVGRAGPPRFEGRTGMIDVVKVLWSFATTAPGVKEKQLFWRKEIASGNRPDGKRFIVTLSEDPTQNFAIEQGLAPEVRGACVVLHLTRYDEKTSTVGWVLKPYVWSFGNDKWKKMRAIAGQYGHEQIGTLELCVSCTDDEYQKLDIFPVGPEQLCFPKLSPTQLERLKGELQKCSGWMDDFLRPDDRARQIEAVTGSRATFASPPAGANPAGQARNALLGSRSAAPNLGAFMSGAGPLGQRLGPNATTGPFGIRNEGTAPTVGASRGGAEMEDMLAEARGAEPRASAPPDSVGAQPSGEAPPPQPPMGMRRPSGQSAGDEGSGGADSAEALVRAMMGG